MKNLYSSAMLLLVCLVAMPAVTFCQDIHFSQFFETPLLRNPSLAGLFDGDIRMQGVYRSQWGSVTVPYQTGSFNMEYKQPIGQNNDFFTTGMQLVYDRAGSTNFTTSNIFPAVNYHKALSGNSNKYLSMGFMGGLVQRRIDRSKITTNNHFDGSGYNPALPDGETFANSNYSYLDGSVGMSFNSSMGDRTSDNYFVGLAYHHVNRPRNSFYRNPQVELSPKWVASAGVRFSVNDYTFLTLHADHSIQGSYSETIGGAMVSYRLGDDVTSNTYVVHFGGNLRWKDALIPVVKLDYQPFSIAFSYDVNVSSLKTASQGRGGAELSITYAGFFQRDNTTQNAVRCPRF